MVKAKTETDAQKIVRLRDKDGMGWFEISQEMGMGQGKCQVLYFSENLDPKDVVKFKDDEDAANKIVKLRDKDNVSWGIIGVRMNISESKVRRLYEEKTGTSTKGNRIGKGGRHPGDETGTRPAKKAAAKKVAAKKAVPAKKAAKATKSTAKKATAEPQKATASKPPTAMNLSELQQRLNGKVVTIVRGNHEDRLKVKAIRSLKDGEIVLTTQDGKSRTILASEIKKASK